MDSARTVYAVQKTSRWTRKAISTCRTPATIACSSMTIRSPPPRARASPPIGSSDRAACSRPPDVISALPRSAPPRYADPKVSPPTPQEICSSPTRPMIACSNSTCRSRPRISQPAPATRSRIASSDKLEISPPDSATRGSTRSAPTPYAARADWPATDREISTSRM